MPSSRADADPSDTQEPAAEEPAPAEEPAAEEPAPGKNTKSPSKAEKKAKKPSPRPRPGSAAANKNGATLNPFELKVLSSGGRTCAAPKPTKLHRVVRGAPRPETYRHQE